MSDDLIDMLQAEVSMLHKLCSDHEAEIERLRTTLRVVIYHIESVNPKAARDAAREALGEDE